MIISSSYYSTLPARQLVLLDTESVEFDLIPLAQADQGVFDQDGNLYFTRLTFQSSHTKRYKGGTVQNLWKFNGSNEAVPHTADYAGTSKNPLFYNNRLYFVTDRDGTMNTDGSDLQQHTKSVAWDLKDSKLGTKGEKGTGLGLILSKEFVLKHDGSIWVESKPGVGSTFYFSIPDKSE